MVSKFKTDFMAASCCKFIGTRPIRVEEMFKKMFKKTVVWVNPQAQRFINRLEHHFYSYKRSSPKFSLVRPGRASLICYRYKTEALNRTDW